MKKILYYCDNCKVETCVKNLTLITIQYENITIKRDFCPFCLAKLLEFVPEMEESNEQI